MKRIVKMYDYAIRVLQNNASIVMAIGSNEAWRDDCLNAVELLRAVRRKNKESRPTVRAKRPVQQPQPKMPSNHVIFPYAMAIVNHTAEVMGASVITRQNSNDKCDKFAIAKIKELLATSGVR